MRDELMLPLQAPRSHSTTKPSRCGRRSAPRWTASSPAGRKEGAVRGAVTSTDIILMGALLAQPLSSAPDWGAIVRGQCRDLRRGLRLADGPPLPGRALTRAVLEQSFTQSSRNRLR